LQRPQPNTPQAPLRVHLIDGILHDNFNRTGSIVANRQFQFDGPPQAGAIYTGGFSVCGNGSLALGASTVWYRCMSGEFGNLYDSWIGEQCSEVRIVATLEQDAEESSTPTITSTGPGQTSWSVESSIVKNTGTDDIYLPPTTVSGWTSTSTSTVTSYPPGWGIATICYPGGCAPSPSGQVGPPPEAYNYTEKGDAVRAGAGAGWEGVVGSLLLALAAFLGLL
jgi:hypothetical protein